MKKKYILIFTIFLSFNINNINAQTEWTGAKITITKANFADWTNPANQDIITENVILTRADNRGLFNFDKETEYDNNLRNSPLDTEWAIGTIADGVGNLTFGVWESNFGSGPTSLLNVDVVLHLITDDIYIDTKLTAWTEGVNSGGTGGGGFTYERSTDQSLGLNNYNFKNTLKLFPNPSSDYIQISGLTKSENYTIYNILGAEVKNGYISETGEMDIKNLTNGLFFLVFENGNALKFIKK
jgi:hypothetical protein